MDYNLCPLCGDYGEFATHLLRSCYFANMVWNYVSSWCKIPPILKIHNSITTTKEKRKTIHAIILTACWAYIWQAMNKKIFENKDINLSKLFQDIKSLGYMWIKNSSSYKGLLWKDWCMWFCNCFLVGCGASCSTLFRSNEI